MNFKSILEAYNANPTEENRKKVMFASCKRKGCVDIFRKKEIADRVSFKYTLDEQVDIVLSGDAEEITALKEYREDVKAEVDAYIQQLESEVEI